MNPSNLQLLQTFDTNLNAITLLVHEKIHLWEHYVVFSWRWWLGVAFTVVPWVAWYLNARKRSDMDRLMYVGLFVMVTALCLDVMGDQVGLWHYRFNVIPLLPTFVPFDLSLVPLSVLLTIQVFRNIHPIIKGVVYALLSSFIGEPFFHALDMYTPIYWRYIYSVPIQVCLYLVAHAIYRSRHRFALPEQSPR